MHIWSAPNRSGKIEVPCLVCPCPSTHLQLVVNVGFVYERVEDVEDNVYVPDLRVFRELGLVLGRSRLLVALRLHLGAEQGKVVELQGGGEEEEVAEVKVSMPRMVQFHREQMER